MGPATRTATLSSQAPAASGILSRDLPPSTSATNKAKAPAPDAIATPPPKAEKTWRLKDILPLLFFPLSLTGCSGDAPTPDAGTPPPRDSEPACDPDLKSDLDQDRDGFPSRLDCDDCDPARFPLEEGATLYLQQSAAICPGTYRNTRIVVEQQDSLILDGSEVTLEQEIESPQAVLELNLTNNIYLHGFTVVSRGIALYLNGGSQNRLEGMKIRNNSCMDAVHLAGSAANHLEDLEIDGGGLLLNLVPTEDTATGGRNEIFSSTFILTPQGCPASGVVLTSGGNQFSGNSLEGLPLYLQGFGENTLEGNFIGGNESPGVGIGLVIYASGNRVEQNIIGENRLGIFLGPEAKNNSILNNDLRNNSDACLESLTTPEDNRIENNSCDHP